MQWLDNLVDKWNTWINTPRPRLDQTVKGVRKVGWYLATLWHYIYLLRGVILSIPVAAVAVVLASKCNTTLPQTVEVVLPGIQVGAEDSLFGFLVYHTEFLHRGTVVMMPLLLTIACLLLTICSKRMLYPWLISVFTLIVPVFLLVTHLYL